MSSAKTSLGLTTFLQVLHGDAPKRSHWMNYVTHINLEELLIRVVRP